MRLTPESELNFRVRCNSGYECVVVYDSNKNVYMVAQRLHNQEPEFALSYRVRKSIRVFKSCPISTLEHLGFSEAPLLIAKDVEEADLPSIGKSS